MDTADLFYYYSVLTSSPFRFLVGPDRKKNSALIPHHPKPLVVLVNGNMSETKEGYGLLQDVDERTFVRSSQYAYIGDYIAPDPDILFNSFTIAFTHLVPNETPIDIDGEEALPPPPPPTLDYAQPEPELEPTRDLAIFGNSNDGWGWSMSERDKKKWRNLEKRGDELEDIAPDAEEPAAVAPRSKKSEL